MVVGNGNVRQARHFKEERGITFELYTDPSLATYEAAGMRRGATLMGLDTLRGAAKAMRQGIFQGATEGDPWQQGGAHLVRAGGEVVWSYISKVAGDHFDPEEPLRRLEGRKAG